MRKGLIFSLVCAVCMAFVSCDKDDDAPVLGADVKVTVKNLFDGKKDGLTVYMYKDHEVTSSTTKESADDQSVTNADGIAEFKLNFTDFGIVESQTVLYFAVFYNDQVVGSTGVTVERNKAYDEEITIPL